MKVNFRVICLDEWEISHFKNNSESFTKGSMLIFILKRRIYVCLYFLEFKNIQLRCCFLSGIVSPSCKDLSQAAAYLWSLFVCAGIFPSSQALL